MDGDFKLSAVLRGHEDDIRALAFPDQRNIFSASRDSTVHHWSLTGEKPPTYDDTTILSSSDWFNCLAYAGPSKEHPQGLIAVAGKETVIFVREIGASPDSDPYRILPRHAHTISSLAFNHDGTRLISGGWDKQTFVWDVEGGEITAELEGHQAAVWGILVYDERLVLTACADKLIRIFDINGKLLHTIAGHTDVVRCFCKIPPGHWSGAAFASAGNDEVVRLWSIDGAAMGELHGHEAYIYAMTILPNGDIVTSSEDRTVRVFRDMKCIQTITHPAISIWAVASCPESGDIVSGASDKTIRIFTRHPEGLAATDVLKSFEESNKMYAIPAETASQGMPFKTEDLPGPEALQTQTGTRDGQQLFVKEHDGSVTAHLWSSSRAQWDLIGTVVSGEGSGTSKKTLDGQEYDYVFDIDIEEGKPPLKLPYNLSESAWDAARKFLERNELPMSYYEQVANWIAENTKGARIGQSAPSQNASREPPSDPWGTDRRYRPGDAPSSYGGKKLPQKSYMTIIEGNPSNAIKIISDKAQASGDLSTAQLESLQQLISQLANKNDPKPTNEQLTALLKIATTWPQKGRVPAIGVLALCAVSSSFVTYTGAGQDHNNIVRELAQAGVFAPKQETANNVVHGIRTVVNLFNSREGQSIANDSFTWILELVRPFASEPESAAQAKALATLYLNYAVQLIQRGPQNAGDSANRAGLLATAIAFMLESDSPHAGEPDALYRALSALGTLLTLGGDFRQQMKMGISGTLHVASTKPNAQLQNIKDVITEIRDELR